MKAMLKYMKADLDRLVLYAALMKTTPLNAKYDKIMQTVLENIETNRRLHTRAKNEDYAYFYLDSEGSYYASWLTKDEFKFLNKQTKNKGKQYRV